MKRLATSNSEWTEVERTIHRMRGVIDNLSLHLAYLVFDLEATKRENEQLRRLLNRRAV